MSARKVGELVDLAERRAAASLRAKVPARYQAQVEEVNGRLKLGHLRGRVCAEMGLTLDDAQFLEVAALVARLLGDRP